MISKFRIRTDDMIRIALS